MKRLNRKFCPVIRPVPVRGKLVSRQCGKPVPMGKQVCEMCRRKR